MCHNENYTNGREALQHSYQSSYGNISVCIIFTPYCQPPKRRLINMYTDVPTVGSLFFAFISNVVWICTNVAMQTSWFQDLYFIGLSAKMTEIRHKCLDICTRWKYCFKLISVSARSVSGHIQTCWKVFCLLEVGGWTYFNTIVNYHSIPLLIFSGQYLLKGQSSRILCQILAYGNWPRTKLTASVI
jgi:hypothetical protein